MRVCALEGCGTQFTVGSRPTRLFCSRRCQQTSRRTRTVVPIAEVLPMVDRLVRMNGSTSAAGRAVADRFALSADSCSRQLCRIRNGHHDYVFAETYDRLWVLCG